MNTTPATLARLLRDSLANSPRGSKAALCRTLDIQPKRLSAWLSGKVTPGAEYALRLHEHFQNLSR